mmetsp:Transcript_22051/g.42337  ORF Transcript_22051/g.42337 Transcript_22051/m.42337 type:complete len:426 (+) Transcript_22051:70-1347(+)
MRIVVIGVACLACGSCGLRVQRLRMHTHDDYSGPEDYMRPSTHVEALLKFFLAPNATTAFTAAFPGRSLPTVKPRSRHLASSIGRSHSEASMREEKDAVITELDEEVFHSAKFWADVDDNIPQWRQAPELTRFREFCENLRTRPTKGPGREINLPNGQQLLTQYIYPGLDGPPERQEYPENDFEELKQLRERLEREVAPAARRELGRLLEELPLESDDYYQVIGEDVKPPSWEKSAWYGWQYLPLRKARRFMPQTALALYKAMGDSGPAHRFVGIARQKADCYGNVHSDGRNYMLSTLTPIVVPPGCGINVNELELPITQDGPSIILDNTFLHQVYNEADEDRFCLVAECWHPLLTPVERDALATLFALRERFIVLQLGMTPWSFDDDDVSTAVRSGAASDLAFWKDTIRYMSEHHDGMASVGAA